MVLVSGVAGVGKSRLAWEFFKYIDGLAGDVLWHAGRCLSYGEGVSYWALSEMVRARLQISEEDPPDVVVQRLRAGLDRWIEDAADREFIAPRLGQLLGLPPQKVFAKEELFSGWRLFFERLSEHLPVLMIVEDLQWADAGLVAFLDHLLEWSGDHAIFLIVLSVRSMTATGRRPLLWVLVGLFAMAVSDSTYAYLVEVGRFSTGNLVDIGWVVGYLAIAVGASGDAGQTVRVPSELPTEASLASLVTPYVPVLLALSVITFELELHHHVDRFSWLTGLSRTLLVIARQALVLVDRRRELFSASDGHVGPASGSTGSWPLYESEPEAAPWPQFLRRTP